jgi:hypothetical protein
MKYMLIHHIDQAILDAEEDGAVEPNPDAERELRALDAELEARGILVGGGVLKAPRASTTVRVRDGEVLIADGPFAETKEQIAGYSVLECADLEQAIEVASRHPTARFGTLELRPYLSDAEPMTSTGAGDDEARALRRFLDYQRAAVIRIVEGLDEDAWHRPIVSSGWTPAGLVEHLGGAERHWFQYVVLGRADELPWDEGLPPYDPHMALTCERPSGDIIAYYREQCARSNAVLDAVPLTAVPLGRHGKAADADQPPNVRWVVFHMIEETACHSGHLDIAREMADGRTNLGGR